MCRILSGNAYSTVECSENGWGVIEGGVRRDGDHNRVMDSTVANVEISGEKGCGLWIVLTRGVTFATVNELRNNYPFKKVQYILSTRLYLINLIKSLIVAKM